MARRENKLVRVLRLLDLVRRRRRGVSMRELCEDVGISRGSARRYVELLIEAGVPLERTRVGEDHRIVYAGDGTEQMPSTAELFALASARKLLSGLEGMKAVAWLDRRLKTTLPAISVETSLAHSSTHARAIETALTERKRLKLTYRGARDEAAKDRVVEPVELRFAQRAWYLLVRDVHKDELRTFKLARVEQARVLPEDSTAVQADPDADDQVSVWRSNDKYDVRIRIRAPAAPFAHEYPLVPSQTIVGDGDDVLVSARVAGLEEVTRWVLRWGGSARVEAPEVLISHVRDELLQAVGNYSG